MGMEKTVWKRKKGGGGGDESGGKERGLKQVSSRQIRMIHCKFLWIFIKCDNTLFQNANIDIDKCMFTILVK